MQHNGGITEEDEAVGLHPCLLPVGRGVTLWLGTEQMSQTLALTPRHGHLNNQQGLLAMERYSVFGNSSNTP